jgi:hypothetical protein
MSNEYMRRCSVPGCGRKHMAKGYCTGHYNRIVTKTTNPDAPMPHKRQCRFPDCPNEIEGYGFCEYHGGSRRGGGGWKPDIS